MKHRLLLIIALVAFTLACNAVSGFAQETPSLPTKVATLPVQQQETAPAPADKPYCGDGVCDGPENAQNCVADCTAADGKPASLPEESGAFSEEGTTYTVQNPTSGAQLLVRVYTPTDWGSAALPALVLVPGGNGSSADFLKPGRKAIPIFTDNGFTVILFDPDGRGKSSGEEDYDGFTQQDGLAAVIEFAASLPEVDATQIGLVSYSYGITMASGALARHPNLPVRFLIDWEGPANRNDTGGCDDAGLGHLQDVATCDDENFWQEREASTFALNLLVPYLRLQSEQDHVQPDYDHAILMINKATSTEYGGNGQAPWTRLNNLTPNQVYSFTEPPMMMPESMEKQRELLIARYAQELLALP